MSVLYLRRRAAPTQAFLLGVQALGCGFFVVFALLHRAYIGPLLWVLVALCGAWAALAIVLAGLLIDILVALVLSLSTLFVVERWRRRGSRP